MPFVQIGIFGLNSFGGANPADSLELARLAEDLGYDSLWAGEHVVLPSPRVAPAPMEPTDPILDPLVWLAFVAGATTRVLLGTGIIILPQRNPLVLAKQVASLDVLSSGRFPGDDKPKPIAFPDPATCAIRGERFALLPMPRWIELKLASGMVAAHRGKDLVDIQELIKSAALPANVADQLHPWVRAKFLELWQLAQATDPF